MASGGRFEARHAEQREVAVRVERHDRRVHRGAVGALQLGRAFAGDDVRVRGDEVRADDEAGAVLDAIAGAADRPSPSSVPTRCAVAALRPMRPAADRGGRGLAGHRTPGGSARPTRRRSVRVVSGGAGKTLVDGTHDPRRPGLLGGPVRHVGHGRERGPHRDQDPEHTGDGPDPASNLRRTSSARPRGARTDEQARRLTEERGTRSRRWPRSAGAAGGPRWPARRARRAAAGPRRR